MAELDQDTKKTALHIQDCRVWAEIYYLDSPTDYREYLPQDCQLGETRADLVILANPKVNGTIPPMLVAGVVLILVSGYLLYLLLAPF